MDNQFNYQSEEEKKNQEQKELEKAMSELESQTKSQSKPSETISEYTQYQKYMNQLLILMRKENASDLFLTVGFPPALKINGEITPIKNAKVLIPEQTATLAQSQMNDYQKKEFAKTNECNFAISLEGIGRFRVNLFRQRGSVGLIIRIINTTIPVLDDLSVPIHLKKIIMEKRGLIIVVGGTGSGKSTTLAAMIGYRNENQSGHIITIEDPIEFVHQHKKSIITQREIGVDTDDWEAALKNTLRQAPDVILIGEIRDRETMEHAIAFSETGHLCLATLHANNANQALDRIINFFPEERKNQLLMDLSLNLKGIISQRLIPTMDNKRRPAVEILLNSARISDLIYKGDITGIKETMKLSREVGMQTFDQALFEMYEDNIISYKSALGYADNLNDLQLRIKLESKRNQPEENNSETIKLRITNLE